MLFFLCNFNLWFNQENIYFPITRFQSNLSDRKIDTKIHRTIVVGSRKEMRNFWIALYSTASRFIKQTIGRVVRKKLIFPSNKCGKEMIRGNSRRKL